MCWKIKEIKKDVLQIDENGLNSMYIVRGSEKSAVIDTGTGTGDFKGLIESLTDQPYEVILTHAHVDHAGGCGQFSDVYIHEKDVCEAKKITIEDREKYIKNMENANAIEKNSISIINTMKNNNKPVFHYIKEGDVINLGNKKLVIHEMPGHTPGSICILDEEDAVLFSGDSVNDIELLCAPAVDRTELLRKWYSAGMKIFSQTDKFDICGGGHCIISIEKAMDTLICGKNIIEGKIEAKKQKIHFFNGLFYRYKDVYLYNGSFEELHQ